MNVFGNPKKIFFFKSIQVIVNACNISTCVSIALYNQKSMDSNHTFKQKHKENILITNLLE